MSLGQDQDIAASLESLWADRGQDEEKAKLCVQKLRRCHSSWDSSKRQWKASQSKSEKHDHTAGCKFEHDLTKMMATGDAYDKICLEMESKHLGGTSLTDTDIRNVSEQVTNITNLIKSANKINNALNQWMAIEPVLSVDT